MKSKKTLLFLLSVLLILQLFVPSANVQAAPSPPELSYSISGDTSVGNIFDINVNISYLTNLYGASIDFKYDPNLIQIVSINRGNLLSDNSIQEPIKVIQNGDASLGITYTGNVSGISSTGTLFTIKARALKTGAINLKTISDNSNLSLVGNNIRVKLSDNNGNAISYNSKASNFSVSTANINKIQEDNPHIVYTGNWNIDSHSAYSSGKAKYTTSPGSSLSFSFTGTGIKLLMPSYPNKGIAKVTIDGVSYNADMYSSSLIANNIVFEKTNLNQDTHNIKVEFTGSKTADSSSPMILVDSFDIIEGNIIPSQPYKHIEEDNANIAYSGTWNNDSHNSYSAGKAKYTTSSNASLSFSFNGTGIRVLTSSYYTRGISKIILDGTVYNVDMYSPSLITSNAVFEKTDLNQGKHSIKIEYNGSKNNDSSGSMVLVDAFDIINGDILPSQSIKHIEEDNANITYSGNWLTDVHNSYSAGKAKYTTSPNSSLSFNFAGTGIKILTSSYFTRGIAKVTIDETSYNVDMYTPSLSANNLVFEKTDLSEGNHTIIIEYTGTKNSNSSGAMVLVDSFDIINGDIIPTQNIKHIEEDNVNINYLGNWINDSHGSYSAGKAKYTNSANSSLSFNFTGTGIKISTASYYTRGIAKITIDGASYNVDMYAPSLKANNLVFEKTDLSQGNHTIKIEYTGTKNSNSTGSMVLVDSFDIINGDISPLQTTKHIEEDNVNISYLGTWNNDSHSSYSSGKAKYTTSSNSSLTFNFTGTGIKISTAAYYTRGIAKVTIDGVSYNVDMYAPSLTANKVVFEKTNLTQGNHTIKMEYTGTKNSNSTGSMVLVDSFDIINGDILPLQTITRIEEDNAKITYSGTWATDSHPAYSAGKAKYSTSSNSSLTFNFTGTGIKLSTAAYYTRGIAKVTIDGVSYNVDMYAPSLTANKIVFEKTDLSQGNHTIKIEYTGSKNSNSTGSMVLVDSFDIINGDIY